MTVAAPVSGRQTWRARRRTALLTLGGLLVALYVLAPFAWLVLTSFMHERDALSVPPQWIPKDPTLDNYLSFFNPGRHARCCRQPRRRADVAQHGELHDRRGRHGGAQRGARHACRLWPGARAVPGQDASAHALSRLAHAAGHRADRAAVSHHQDLRPARQPRRADRHLPDVHAAVHDLAAEELLPEHPARAGGGGAGRRLHLGLDGAEGAAAGGRSRPGGGRHVRIHDRVERLPVRRHPDEHDQLQDLARRGRRIRNRRDDRAHADGGQRRACSDAAAACSPSCFSD